MSAQQLSNIDRFNAYATYILGKMYEDFPIARKFEAAAVVNALKLPPANPSDAAYENTFATYTNKWLAETGYLIVLPGTTKDKFVLAPKAFEALATKAPSALQPKAKPGESVPAKTVGDKMSEFATEIGKEAAAEAKKKMVQSAKDLIGIVITWTMKAVAGG